ncbi:MAG: sensor histidine kinase [Ruminococcus sp.]
MKRTVFKRFLFFSLCAAFICVLIVTGILSFPVSEFIEQSGRLELDKNARGIAQYISDAAKGDISSLNEDESRIFTKSLDAYADSLHAVVVFADADGKVVYSSSEAFLHKWDKLPSRVMEHISDGEHFEYGNLGNATDSKRYISAVPVTDSATDKVTGYLLVAQSTLWTSNYTPSVFTVLIVLILIAAIVIFILSAVYAYNATRPLKQLTAAAKSFAVGDFTSRVKVKSNDEMGELANAFNEMADSLASSEGMRRNFISNVSHELKTPMTTIAGYIDGILDGTINKEEQDRYLAIVSAEVKRLSRLVTSMISLSKIDSGEIKVNKEKFILEDTVFSVLFGFDQSLSQKHITVEGLSDDTDTYAYGDKDLIYQVIYNLVENAVKFTNEGGYIRFGFSNTAEKTCVYIENSGAGILPEDLRLVFDKFYKGDKSRSAHKNSMGLGLYIAKTIIQLHEGSITAESEPGKYCRFVFYLPTPPGGFRKLKKLPDSIKEENQ